MATLITTPPKSQQIADSLAEKIEKGILKPGARVYSVRSLAEKHSVSIAVIVTAFNILEKKGLIIREGGRGTFVKGRKKKSKNNIFGIVTTYKKNNIEGYFEDLNKVFFEYNALGIPTNYFDKKAFKSGLDIIKKQNPAGLFFDVEAKELPLTKIREVAGDLPLCFVHRWEWDGKPFAPAVLTDFTAMYQQGLNYFFERGHRRIAVIGHPHHTEPLSYMEKRLEKTAKALGFRFPSYEIEYVCNTDFIDNKDRIERVFSSDDRPTALFGMSDFALIEFKSRLEKFISFKNFDLLGVYNTSWSRLPGNEFSTFNIDYFDMWTKALELCLNNDKENIIYLKPELIKRS